MDYLESVLGVENNEQAAAHLSVLYTIINNIKSITQRSRPREEHEESWKNVQIILERSAIECRVLRDSRQLSSEKYDQAISIVKGSISSINFEPFYVDLASHLQYRNLGAPRAARIRESEIYPQLNYSTTINHVISIILNDEPTFDRQQNLFPGDKTEISENLSRLARIIPDQKISPIKFSVQDNKIVVDRATPQPERADSTNTSIARSHIESAGKTIIEQLSRSNCDSRLIDVVTELHSSISSDQNVIITGLNNIRCSTAIDAFANELPDAVVASLRAYTLSISMFSAQFPDWNRFVDNAKREELEHFTSNDAARIVDKVIDATSANPSVDNEVPNLIRAIGNLVRDPKGASKSALFAAVRTVENLISKAFEYSLELIEQTIKKSIDNVSSAIAKRAPVALLALAIGLGSSLLPLTGGISSMKWVQTAIEIGKKELDRLNKIN